MFVLDFMRYCRGYVEFRAQGVFVERFLNLVARDRIPVWDGRKRGEVYTGYTDAKSYKKLRRHAKKAGVKIRVTEKRGVPFTRRKYRKRKGLLVGLTVFLGFIMLMSSFIWRIEVHGNDLVPESRIIETLDAMGISPGTFRASIDVRDAERRALLALEDLSWIALNIDGSTIYVEVNESVPPPTELIDPNTPCNVVASAPGQILYMNVYEGQPLVQEGDTILPGDMIVSGITQDRMGQNLFKHARAQIIAQVEQEIVIEVPINQTEYVETGETKERTYLGLFDTDLPLFLPFKIPHPYHVDRSRTPLTFLGITLPFSRFDETYYLMEEVPVVLSEAEAKAQAVKELNAVEQIELAEAEIVERKGVGRLEGEIYTIRTTYICNMDIAVEKEILLDEEPA